MATLHVTARMNLDLGGVPPSDLSIDHIPLELADAELGFAMRPRSDIGMDVVLVHEDGQATFDRAFGTWTSPVATLAFGKQTLPLGFYAGRLLHDPLIQQDLESIAPSILARRDLGSLGLHLALATEPHSIDSSTTGTHPTGLVAIDYSWSSIAKIRLSGKCAHHLRLIDFGAEIDGGVFVIDLEGLAADGIWARADYTGLAGLCWRATRSTAISTRFDARKPRGKQSWTRSIATGAVQSLADIAFVGVEWLQDLDGDDLLTLRWGLEIELLGP